MICIYVWSHVQKHNSGLAKNAATLAHGHAVNDMGLVVFARCWSKHAPVTESSCTPTGSHREYNNTTAVRLQSLCVCVCPVQCVVPVVVVVLLSHSLQVDEKCLITLTFTRFNSNYWVQLLFVLYWMYRISKR